MQGAWRGTAYVSPAPGPGLSRVALVMGNNAYTHWPGLEKGTRDAEDMAALLGCRGYHVTRVLNGEEATMRRAVETFAASLPTQCIAVVFFSGHGQVSAGVAQLVPIDGLLASPDRGNCGVGRPVLWSTCSLRLAWLPR